jgi:hypothetical protein
MSNRAHRRPAAGAAEPPPRRTWLTRLLGRGTPRSATRTGPVAVGFVSSRAEAEVLAGYLHSHGIRAAVSADDEGGLNPVLQAGRRVRVLVPASDEARANQLIADTS